MERFNALMDERRYAVAVEEVAPEVEQLAAGTPLAASVAAAGRFQRSYHELRDVWNRRERGYLAGMHAVEASLVPASDIEPIVYPDSAW
jgi:hypothetical protein